MRDPLDTCIVVTCGCGIRSARLLGAHSGWVFSWFCERVLRQGALDECVAVRRDCVGPTSGSGSAAVNPAPFLSV